MIPAETKWALRALQDARDRLNNSQEILIEGQTWALNPQQMFASATEALMWVVVLDDWYKSVDSAQYADLKPQMASLLKGLRWARNLAVHDFALITMFTERYEPGDDRIHPGWQRRDVLPQPDPHFGQGSAHYDARVAGRAIIEPIEEAYRWFFAVVEPAISSDS